MILTYFKPEPIAIDIEGTNLYVAGYKVSQRSDYVSYFVMQADPKNEVIKSMTANVATLAENPQRVFGSSNGSNPNKAILDIVKTAKDSEQIDQDVRLYLDDDAYFSISDLKYQQMNLLKAVGIGALVVAIFEVGPLLFIWSRRRNARKAEKEFFGTYPELNGSLQNVKDKADYVDEKAGLAIYQDYLISFCQAFGSADIRKAKHFDIMEIRFANLFFTLIFGKTSTIKVSNENKKERKILFANAINSTPGAKADLVEALNDYSTEFVVK